jgi:hypothetical protein
MSKAATPPFASNVRREARRGQIIGARVWSTSGNKRAK